LQASRDKYLQRNQLANGKQPSNQSLNFVAPRTWCVDN